MSQVAYEALKALGANKFVAMTGAKNLVALDNGVQFTLPSKGVANKANLVRVTVNDKDLYCISFLRLTSTQYREIEAVDNIFVEDLQTIFTNKTGLLTTLGTCA